MTLATFVIAVVGVVLAAISIGWQAASFFLSGPRVRVRLAEGFAGDAGVMLAPPSAYTEAGLAALVEMGYREHVLAVEAVNAGRLPATVELWTMRFANDAAFQHPYDPHNPTLPFRLDAHTRAVWYAEADQLQRLQAEFTDPSDDAAALRAEVRLGNGKIIASRNRLIVRANSIREPVPSLARRLARRLGHPGG